MIHWKVKAKARCGKRTGRLTIIANDVTCLQCLTHVAKAWDELIRRSRGIEPNE